MIEMTAVLKTIEEIPDMGITLHDGVRLSARVWRPVDTDQHPVPAILEYLPYRKRDGTCARDALTHPYFAKRGYACVRVDLRGNGDSDGLMTDEYTQQELDDAVEVIHWLSKQSWCSGHIGMMGISWGGFNALQTAALNPEPLKAIITLCSTVDRFFDDIHYKGGCLLNENLGWGATMWAYSSRAPDPQLRPSDWRRIWLDRLNQLPFLPSIWLRHQTRDDYWRHGSVCEQYDAITAKVLAIGGWGDAYRNAVPQLVQNLPDAHGVIGPWVHKYPHFAAPEPRIGFLQEALRWWDRWLKNMDNGVEQDSKFKVYILQSSRPSTWYTYRPGRWITTAPETRDFLTLHLSKHQLGDPKPFKIDVCSPLTTGTHAGEYCALWLGPDMPADQRTDDALSACFDSQALPEDTTIVGAPKVLLRLTSDSPQGQIAVRLNHVHPDGASYRITYGVLNLAHREDSENPSPVPVGDTLEIVLQLDHIAYCIPKGHRLRLAISTSYWPLIWPSPTVTTLTISAGQVILPLCLHANETELPAPVTEKPMTFEELRKPFHSRKTLVDHATGATTLEIVDDFGKSRDADHGLISGSACHERWTILPDDPCSAQGVCQWTTELERDETNLRVESHCAMMCDTDAFHLSAKLDAFENDDCKLQKIFIDSVPRRNL